MTAPGNQYPSQYPQNPPYQQYQPPYQQPPYPPPNQQYPPQYQQPQYPYAPPPPPPPGYGQPQYPPQYQQPQYPPPAARRSRRADGVKQLTGGAIALVVGLAITIGTYQLASGGGSYFVAYGPMIFGVIYVFKGLANIMRG
jgi:hypothetical protein